MDTGGLVFLEVSATKTNLGDVLRCLAAAGQRLYHLGWRSIARSTIVATNREWPVAFFQELFERGYQTGASKASGHKFRFKTRLFSLDSSTVNPCLSVFPWAAFRQGQAAGIKMRTVLDHDGYVPAFVGLTGAKFTTAVSKRFCGCLKGSIVAFDRGYNDYCWFDELTREGVFFVTRLKPNAVHQPIGSRAIRPGSRVKADHTIKVVRKELSLKSRGLE